MNIENTNESNKYLNLSNVASLASFSILIAGAFSILRCHLYYQVLLHVPIFHYIDVSELLLMTASTGTAWIIYLTGIFLPPFIRNEKGFTKFQKIVFCSTIYAFAIAYFILNFRNDPIITAVVKWPILLKNSPLLICIIVLLILIIIAFIELPIFFKKNNLIMPLVLSLFYALFIAWANYDVVTHAKDTNNIMVQTKSMGVIKTNDTLIDAGRTKNFWFFYNRKTHVTRVIKADDIEFVDFEADNK